MEAGGPLWTVTIPSRDSSGICVSSFTPKIAKSPSRNNDLTKFQCVCKVCGLGFLHQPLLTLCTLTASPGVSKQGLIASFLQGGGGAREEGLRSARSIHYVAFSHGPRSRQSNQPAWQISHWSHVREFRPIKITAAINCGTMTPGIKIFAPAKVSDQTNLSASFSNAPASHLLPPKICTPLGPLPPTFVVCLFACFVSSPSTGE